MVAEVLNATARSADSEVVTQRMTGGQALVEMLKRQGVNTIFGLPGVQLDGLFNALYDNQDAIRVIHTRHEQATAYMADGYARVTGREGVCLVVPGPGLLNATAALSTAYAVNSPVLCLTGQIRSEMIEFGRGLLHEIPNQLGMIRSVTKHAARATTPDAIPGTVQEAFRQLRTGRPRPVEVEVPPDTFFAEADVTLLPPAGPRERPAGDPDMLARAAKFLGEARSPVIYSGGGVLRSSAWEELHTLAELLQAPVIMTSNGKGAVSDRHYLAQLPIADRELFPSADVVLAVGTRFVDGNSQPRAFAPGQTLIRLDIDDEEVERNQPADIALVADAKAGLAALIDAIPAHNRKRPSRESELTTLKQGLRQRVDAIQPQAGFAAAIRNELPDEGIIVGEMTQLGYWSMFGLPVYAPNTYLTAGYQGTLGFGFTTALGAKIGKPNVPVVSFNGDGGFGFTLNELATMAQHNIGVVTIVFNDNAYGNVRRIQNVDYNGKIIASELKNPNYQKLADAFGITGRLATDAQSLQTAVRESIRADVMPNPWRVLGIR